MTSTPAARFPIVGDTILGRYRLQRVIAKGGMGMVYLAQQLSMDRDVAIKMVLPQNMDNEQTLARFEREVYLAKQLRHPNVVELYDFGRTEGGVLYLVMELLDGSDLKALIARTGPLTVARCGHIGMQVLDALCVAHQRGIVHRDLKPSNVFVTTMGRHADFVKLLDFGVAKSLGPDESDDLTQQGQVCGTSAYMAPEMFVTGSVDLTVDIYAMGLILLEMLIGQKIFQGSTTAENMFLHLQQGVTIPEPIAPTSLGAVLRRATARRASERYQTADEMLEELERALEATPDDLQVDREHARRAVAVVPSDEDVLDQLLGGAHAPGALETRTADSSDLLIVEYESGKKFSPPPLSRSLRDQTGPQPTSTSDVGMQTIERPADETAFEADPTVVSSSDVVVPDVHIDDTPMLGAESTEPKEADRPAHVAEGASMEGPRSSHDVLQTIRQPSFAERFNDAASDDGWPDGVEPPSDADLESAPTTVTHSGEYLIEPPTPHVEDDDARAPQPTREANPAHPAAAPSELRPDRLETPVDHAIAIEQRSPKRWIPAAILVAGLLLVGGAIGASAIFGGDDEATTESPNETDEAAEREFASAEEGAEAEVSADPVEEPEPAPTRWNVRITSVPPGARILDGEQELGVTPTTMSMGEGTVPDSVTLELEGYEALVVDIDTEPGGGELSIEKELVKKKRRKRRPPKKPTKPKKKPKKDNTGILDLDKFD